MNAELSFHSNSVNLFSNFLKGYQTEATKIHDLYSDLKDLVIMLANRPVPPFTFCSSNPKLKDLEETY